MAVLVLLNNFMHDFSAAGWLFGAVALWALRRRVPDEPVVAVTETTRTLVWLMRLNFLGIVLFGVGRTLAYRQYEWSDAAGDSQVTLLIVKHVILTGAFVVGLVEYIKAARYLKALDAQ